MKPLVSAIIPTRKRVPRLMVTLDSLIRQADDPSCLEIVLKVDEDDEQTRRYAPSIHAAGATINIVISPRGRGYVEMGRFVTEACAAATGQWCFLIDDDSWIIGKGWDTLLKAVPIENCVASCEFYHLGKSHYGSGSCGPVGLFFPNGSWKKYGVAEIPSPADECLRSLLVDQQGYKVHLLKGIIYHHDRDSQEVLNART